MTLATWQDRQLPLHHQLLQSRAQHRHNSVVQVLQANRRRQLMLGTWSDGSRANMVTDSPGIAYDLPRVWAQRQGGPPGEQWQVLQRSLPLHGQREPQQGGCPWSLRKHRYHPAWWQQHVHSLTWQPWGHHVSQP